MKRFESVVIENSTFCNANCVMCEREKLTFPLSNMSQELFEKSIHDMSTFYSEMGGLQIVDFGGMGESLMDPEFGSKVKWLRNKMPNVVINVTTNGQVLNKWTDVICDYVDNIKFSNYGFSKQAFEIVHRDLYMKK